MKTLHMASDVEVIVQPKWKIASKSTGTETTFAIGSVKDISLQEPCTSFRKGVKMEELSLFHPLWKEGRI